MLKKITSFSAIASVNAAASDHWAVLVAGSKGYDNYRHQADVCHAYQVLKNNGVPLDQIILMSYNDVVQDPTNPLPGTLWNAGTRQDIDPPEPGYNVYPGCGISYSGDDVTAEAVLAVLTGDSATAGGPVLKTNSNSSVFLFITGLGAPGLVDMPTNGDSLYAD